LLVSLSLSIIANLNKGLRHPVSEQSLRDAARPAIPEAEPMRVLHVHSGNMYGGVETMLLTQAQQRNSYPALELSYALCFAGRLSEELTAVGAHPHWLSEARVRQPLSIRRARRNLRDLLRQQPCDVVITHSSWSQAIFGPVVRAADVPLVLYLHGPAHGRHWLERWARRTEPDVALCNSQFTAGTLSGMYPRTRSEVLYCPVALPDHAVSETDKRALRAELQTPEDATVIIQVSRMEAWKGHVLHLEALSQIKDLSDWVCWQVGGAQRPDEIRYLSKLKKAAARLGIKERVRFVGERTDVARLLAAADIYCQPNTGPEPFGIAFIEALHARLPVITTAIGGACEIVDDSCGLLTPPGDSRALAAHLRRLIEDRALRVRLGAAGPLRARQLCDPAEHMSRFGEALASAIQKRRGKK
jgi:glycosyltransferase involved in cell wall biosynthesis